MSQTDAVNWVFAHIVTALNELQVLFNPGTKLSFLARAAKEDGSQDMFVSADDVPLVLRAVRQRLHPGEQEQMWFVGQVRGDHTEGQGIFSSEARAVAACRNANYFVCPFFVDQEVPDETISAPADSYYPLDLPLAGA